MDETTQALEASGGAAVGALESASSMLDAILANPEPIGALGGVLALIVGVSTRFGGQRFKTLVESIPLVATFVRRAGELLDEIGDMIAGIAKKGADILDALYDAIKSNSPKAVILLGLLSLGCGQTYIGIQQSFEPAQTREECQARIADEGDTRMWACHMAAMARKMDAREMAIWCDEETGWLGAPSEKLEARAALGCMRLPPAGGAGTGVTPRVSPRG